MNPIDTIEHDELTANLYYDEMPMSPAEWDILGTFEHALHGYSFASGKGDDYTGEPERGWPVYIRSLTLFGEAFAVLPVYLGDHGSSGFTLYESDAKNCNGVYFTTAKRARELCGDDVTPAQALDGLRSELTEWHQFLNGDVYVYIIEQKGNGDTVESCGGFYGYEYALTEMRDALTDAVEEQKCRKIEIAKGWALAHGLVSR